MTRAMRACFALAACAAFVGATTTASANNLATIKENGVSLTPSHAKPIGILDTQINKAFTLTDGSGNSLVACDTLEVHANLETNTGHVIEATITKVIANNHATSECASTFGGVTYTGNSETNGLPWCLHSTSTMATDEFQIRGNDCVSSERGMQVVIDTTSFGSCTYERSAPIVGTFTTGGTQAEMNISKQEFKRIAGSFLCPTAGFMDAAWLLETTADKKPLVIANGT